MMATGIAWTDETLNPVVGCSVTSPGCTNCYAMRMAARLEAMGVEHYRGLTKPSKAGAVWTGKVALAPDSVLLKPLRWKRPRKIFVNSMGDLFHPDVPDAWIDQVFAVAALTPRHTYQILTKQAARMRAYLTDPGVAKRIIHAAFRIDCEGGAWMSADSSWHLARGDLGHLVWGEYRCCGGPQASLATYTPPTTTIPTPPYIQTHPHHHPHNSPHTTAFRLPQSPPAKCQLANFY